MPKECALPESSNRTRVSPYPLRSSRTTKHKALESFVQSEWEDKRCVICMEPPHNAVVLTCASFFSGCRPYMCGTSSRHSNCFKQFRKTNKKKRSNAAKTLNCPLCRGEVFETTKVTKPARRFMNGKPRSCPVDDCEFSGTYSQLGKHLKNEHRGRVPPKVDPQRQSRWEQMQRHDEYVALMDAAGIVHHQLPIPNTHQVFRMTVDGTFQSFIVPHPGINGFGPANYNAAPMPTLQFPPMGMYRNWIP